MMKIIFVVVALCLRQAAGLCSSNAGFDFSKTLNYNAIVTGYKVNVKRIVGNGLGNKIVIDNYCNPITQTQVGSMVSFVLSSGKPTTAPTSMPLAKPSKGPTSAPLAKPSKKPTAKPVVQAVCPAVSYDLQKSVTINTTATGYKVNVKRIVGNGLGNKIVLDGYASKPIVTQGTTGSAMSFAISSGALCNAPPPTIKPTAKPVVQQSSVKPTAKPVVQAVCPAVSYDLQKSVTINTTATGYKVNVKRIVGNGLGNKIVLDGYASKPIVTQGMTGSAMSFAISSGALCNAPPPTIKPTAKPVVQAVCPAVSYDLQKSVTISTTATGYKVNVKRIVGNGLGNKIVLDGYASKPIITQSTTGSAMSFAISSGALCNAPPPSIKPTAKPVVKQSSVKPTAKPVGQAVCPAVSYDLQKSVTMTTGVFTGYKVNVKRIVGNGLGNKIVLDGYASKPIITQGTTGSAMSFAISSGALCNAPPSTIRPTAKPVVQQSSVKPTAKPVGQAVCPAVSYDLQKSVTISTTITGYKVNVKRIVGKGVGNKIVLDGYASKPIVTQGMVGSTVSLAISSGSLCNAPGQTFAPTARPVGQAVCPSIPLELPTIGKWTFSMTGYKVNVIRTIGKGVGNKVIFKDYLAKPLIDQSVNGSTSVIKLSPGALCNGPATIPTLQPANSGGSSDNFSCPNLPFDLPINVKMTATVTGYKVNIKRVIGKGVGNKVIVSNYSVKPILTQAGSGSVISVMLTSGSKCGKISMKPTKKPSKIPTKKPIITPTKSLSPSKKPTIIPTKAPISSASLLGASSKICSSVILSLLVLAKMMI